MEYKLVFKGEPKTEFRATMMRCPVCQHPAVVSCGFEKGRHWAVICPEDGCNYFEVGVYQDMVMPKPDDEADMGGVTIIPWASGHVEVVETGVSVAPQGEVLVLGKEKATYLGDTFEAAWQAIHPRAGEEVGG